MGDIGKGQYKTKIRPYFKIDDYFTRTFSLRTSRTVKPPMLARCEELNATKVAIKFSTVLNKDMVFSGLRDFIVQIGEAVSRGQEVAIAFSIGTLYASERKISFQFDPKLLMEIMSRPIRDATDKYVDEASENATMPDTNNEDSTNNDDDDACDEKPESDAMEPVADDPDSALPVAIDLGTIDAERSALETVTSDQETATSVDGREIEESLVVEDAYRRYLNRLQRMVEETAFEKNEFVRKVEADKAAADAALLKRQKESKDLQKFLLHQIDEKGKRVQSERVYDRAAGTYCSFPPLVDSSSNHGALRMTPRSKHKLQLEMRQALIAQMEHKVMRRQEQRRKEIEKERKFVEQVQQRMLDTQKRKQVKRIEMKRRLVQAWDREAKLKELLRRGMNIHSKIHPPKTQLETPRSIASEYSIGYDQRTAVAADPEE